MNARVQLAPGLDDPDADSQVAQLRIPPHSNEAESSVLGGLLLDNRAWDLVGDLLVPDDFFRFQHRLVYEALSGLLLAGREADTITVFERLRSIAKEDEAGGLVYLNALAQYVPSAANIRRYAEVVREMSVRRRLISTADEIATAAFNPQGRAIGELIDIAQAGVMKVDQSTGASGDGWQSMEDMMIGLADDVQASLDAENGNGVHDFVPTGLQELDDLLDGGMRGGEVIILGARPRMGKSALAKTIELNIAKGQGLPVAEFQMEMQNKGGAMRAMSSRASIPLHKLRRPKRMGDVEWTAFTRGIDELRAIPLHAYDRGALNINQLRSQARKLHRRVGGLRLLVVDYFQLMAGVDPRQLRSAQLEEASRGLKSLAKELNIPILVLAAVLRGVEKETDQMPQLSDLKDCGSLEQDADIVWFMHRDDAVKAGLGEEWKRYCRFRVAKNRNGQTGEIPLYWEGQYTRYSSWPADLDVPQNTSRVKGRAL